ncbi:hypothetical protein F4809DRAFT_660772 [Biscogniauxia mediterranea]|nr:hypothetical protein F4809DRAFT_660772 [Biscogniauxia mediterranea]
MPRENNPNAKAWIVKSKVEPNKSVKLWMRPEFHQKLQLMYPKIPGVDDLYHPGGFVNGRPMTNIAMKISTFAGKARPKILYRVVHARQPHYGMKARGYGIVSIPEESIIECRLLEDTIPKYDPESRCQPMIEQELGGSRKRKRELDETDEAEEEFEHPDEHQTQEGVNDNSEVGSDANDDTVMVKRRLVSKRTTDFKLRI